MSFDTLRKIFSATIPYYDEVRFIWHGGEPTSMGKAFYKEVIRLQKEINKNNTKITNSIQSNLTLLDCGFAKFLIENGFKIGSSFDGTKNDLTRFNSQKILDGRKIVTDNGGRVGFICVVQRKNIDNLIEDYEWFKKNHINYTLNQYMATPPYENDELFVPTEHYIKRICELYDYWAKDVGCNINISYFEDFIDYHLFGKKYLCCYNSCLGKHIGVQYNGDIYNCNRDFPKEYSFGNIHDYTDIHQCFESAGFENLVKKAVERRNYCKENCEIYDFCNGGCNSTSLMGGDISRGNKYVCDTIIAVYKHIEKSLNTLKAQPEETWKTTLNPKLCEKLMKYSKGKIK